MRDIGKAVKFDSDEYWKIKTWDRFKEVKAVRQKVRDEFLFQEEITVESILSVASERGFLRILDLASGTGKISDSVLKHLRHGVHMTLVDFNARTLNKARTYLSNHGNIDFYCLNAYHITQTFGSEFDVVLCLDFLHHVSDMKSLLTSIHDILIPSGILIGNILAAETYNEWDRIKYGLLKSSRRRLLNTVSRRTYGVSPTLLKKLIRISGVARIEPLTVGQLTRRLETFFAVVKITSTYYHWFFAVRKD